MATFVHNEPSSLAVVQEAGLPEVFYEAIEAGLEPAIEVMLHSILSLQEGSELALGHSSVRQRHWSSLFEPDWAGPAQKSTQHHSQHLLDLHFRPTPEGAL